MKTTHIVETVIKNNMTEGLPPPRVIEIPDLDAAAESGLTEFSITFLKAIFGARWQDAWVCWTANMAGKRVRDLVEGDLPHDGDCYFSVGLMKPGATKRSNANVETVHALVIDDVGVKIDMEAMELFAPTPSWTLETSPGSFHYGYIIEGMTVPEYEAMRRDGKASPIWGHSDGIDPCHLFRLPQGVNTKHEKVAVA